jgi:hypothetical protein
MPRLAQDHSRSWHKIIPDHFRIVSLSATMPRLAQDHSRSLSDRFAVCDNAKIGTRSFPTTFGSFRCLRQCQDWHTIISRPLSERFAVYRHRHWPRSFPITFGSFRCLRQCQDWHTIIPDHFRIVSLSATMPRLAHVHSRSFSERLTICDNAMTGTRSFPITFGSSRYLRQCHDWHKIIPDHFRIVSLSATLP